MGLKDWFNGLRKPVVVPEEAPWQGRNRRASGRKPKITSIDCPACRNRVQAWKTYADGSQHCLDCAVRGES